MKTLRFNKFGKCLSTRMLGIAVRDELTNLIDNNDLTVLDFEGVDIVTNSFVDECIAGLLDIYDFEIIKQKTTFRNTTNFVEHCILTALKRKDAVLPF